MTNSLTNVNNNVVAFNPTQLPAHLRATALSDATKALMGSSSGFRLSIKAGVWRLLSNGKEYAKMTARELDVVVVAASPHVSRTFYTAKFDEDATPTAPDCFSRDGKIPDAKSAHRQHDNCDACPQNAKGSGQGDSKACRYNQSLAVVLANDIGGTVLKFQVPAASIFGKGEGANLPLREYVTQLASVPVNIDVVVTKMSFDLDASAPKIFFAPVRYLSESEYATVQQQGKTEAAKRAIEMTVFESDGAAAKPALAIPGTAPAAPPPPVVAAPPPEPEETEEEKEAREYAEFKAAKAAKAGPKKAKKEAAAPEPATEPTVRPTAPAAPSPGRANLSNILAQWDKPEPTDD
jgi:hypothetical protein